VGCISVLRIRASALVRRVGDRHCSSVASGLTGRREARAILPAMAGESAREIVPVPLPSRRVVWVTGGAVAMCGQ
jgi:hypothetical protein